MRNRYPESIHEMINWIDSFSERFKDRIDAHKNPTDELVDIEAYDIMCMTIATLTELKILAPAHFQAAVERAAQTMRAAEMFIAKMKMSK